jgi:hypothetical protein
MPNGIVTAGIPSRFHGVTGIMASNRPIGRLSVYQFRSRWRNAGTPNAQSDFGSASKDSGKGFGFSIQRRSF